MVDLVEQLTDVTWDATQKLQKQAVFSPGAKVSGASILGHCAESQIICQFQSVRRYVGLLEFPLDRSLVLPPCKESKSERQNI